MTPAVVVTFTSCMGRVSVCSPRLKEVGAGGRGGAGSGDSELRSYVKVEVAVLGSQSPVVTAMDSVDAKQH